jgi:hypothetical protein
VEPIIQKEVQDEEQQKISIGCIPSIIIILIGVFLVKIITQRMVSEISQSAYVAFLYLLLAVSIVGGAIPWVIFRFFRIGGELPLELFSEKGELYAFLNINVPRLIALAIITSCVFLDWLVCLSIFGGAVLFVFIALPVSDAVTKDKSINFLSNHVLVFHVLAISTAILLLALLFIDLIRKVFS